MINRTSVSDDGAYPQFCYFAANRDDIFENFKTHPVYCRIIPGKLDNYHVPLGAAFLNIIFNHYNLIFDDDVWNKLTAHDKVGNPDLVTYSVRSNQGVERKITCSQLTPRYVKVAADILSFFDTDNIKVISEIGVGYAAQCNVLLNLLPDIQYNLVDLPEVLALAERCLNSINMNHNVRYFDGNHLYHNIHSDLVISEFAFSELFRPVQDIYLDKIILNSKAGYITWNDGNQHKIWDTDGYSLNDILSIIPGSKAIHLPPTMYQFNQETCTIIWGFI